MDRWKIYRLALKLMPVRREKADREMPESVKKVLRANRVRGASLAEFDGQGVEDLYCYGRARKNTPVTRETRFRTASVSKHITALCCMKLYEQGRLDLEMDISDVLGFTVRHPAAPETPITLKMLLSHTAGIRDGETYNRLLGTDADLEKVLQGDSFTEHLPGEKWEYSNLGAGIVGCVLEGVTGMNFDSLMRETVFEPLGVTASFYPQRLGEPLADAWRVLPRAKTPGYNAEERLTRPLPRDCADVRHNWALAHGNLCITARELALLGHALMRPGYLKESTLEMMRTVIAPFGTRARNLSEGIGTFVLKDPGIAENTVYGHQGLAYGAVHGLFYDPQKQRGFAVLTTGCSEARSGVLTDMNAELIRLLIG